FYIMPTSSSKPPRRGRAITTRIKDRRKSDVQGSVKSLTIQYAVSQNFVSENSFYDRRGANLTSIDVPPVPQAKLLNRIQIAIKHYLDGDPSLKNSPHKLFSHLDGIDFTMPVDEVTLGEGTRLNQLQPAGVG